MSKNKSVNIVLNYFSFSLLIVMGLYFIYISGGYNYAAELVTGPEKNVGRGILGENAPIETLDFKVGEKVLTKNTESFQSDDKYWYKDLSFKVRNMTFKKITYISMLLTFPETKESGPEMGYTLSVGLLKGKDPSKLKLKNVPVDVPSNEDLTIDVSKNFEEVKNFISTREPKNGINKIIVRFDRVNFDDGTIWTPGSKYQKPSPSDPEIYIKTDVPELIYKQRKMQSQ